MDISNLILKLKLDKQEFVFQFQSHPNYPSALAFSDTLNFMGFKNDAYNLDKECWHELPEEFITIYKNNFALIKNIGQEKYTIYSKTTENISKENLFKYSQDFVLLFEKTENQNKKSTFSFKFFIYFIFGIFFLYSVILQNWYETLYTLLSMAGVYISMELFNGKFGQTSAILNSICGNGIRTETIEDSCSKIIKSDTFNVLGLKFSDFSLIYFISIFLIGLFLPVSSLGLKYLNFATLFVIGYSLYIQIVKEKAFCKICFVIILILISQLVISFLFFNFSFSFQALFLSIICFATIISLIMYANNTLTEKEKTEKENIKNLRFKRNYELFRRELTTAKNEINFEITPNIFTIGNKEAYLKIDLVSNPFCAFCKGAHEIIENLLNKYPENILVRLRFNYCKNSTDEQYKDLLKSFISIYKNNTGKDFLQALAFWFENRDVDLQLKNYPFNNENYETEFDSISKITKENFRFGLTFTPMFIINNYQFPNTYERKDIYYFIDELLEDEEIINEKNQTISAL